MNDTAHFHHVFLSPTPPPLDTTVYIPSFDGTSYLELRPVAYFFKPSGTSNNLPATVKDKTVHLFLTVKAREMQGTILYSEYSHFIIILYR